MDRLVNQVAETVAGKICESDDGVARVRWPVGVWRHLYSYKSLLCQELSAVFNATGLWHLFGKLNRTDGSPP